MKKIILTILILVVCFSQSFAFDGNRKGFTLGFGLGYAPNVKTDLHVSEKDLSYEGFGGNIFLGYCWDDKNLLVLGNVGAVNIITQSGEDKDYFGVTGFNWYHYFKPESKTFFSILGIGQLIVEEEMDSRLYETNGLGLLVGGGYEFARQVQFSVYLLGGKTSSINLSSTNSMIMATVTVLAY